MCAGLGLGIKQFRLVPASDFETIAPLGHVTYSKDAMLNLTRSQQQFLCVVLLLLLIGWAVKAWRAAHPPTGSASAGHSHLHPQLLIPGYACS
jgi:hypothetical protein